MASDVMSDSLETPLPIPSEEPRAGGFAAKLALRIMQAGAIAVVPAATTFFAFELDRFFIPKELVLHLTAVLAGLVLLRGAGRIALGRVDYALFAVVALSAASAIFATNPWLAMRALAITASAAVLYWSAQRLRAEGLAGPLLSALALAIVAAAVTSLMQTYGIETTLFSENRAPGGTLGNRNFVAHAAAFGLPLVLLAALSARRALTFLFGAIGVAVVTSSLVLTRSRAAWLAFACVVALFALATLIAPQLRRDRRTWRRLALIAMLSGGAVAAALLIPNTLQWRSDNPYLESVRRVADYQSGSGRGRLVQYRRSLLMALRHPIFGVGPGNWPVEYPGWAARNDPSLSDSEGGTTSNPWPSSDWIAWISERGVAVALLMALALLWMALGGLRRLREAADVGQALTAATLMTTIAGVVVTGAFDAVMLLGLPALLVWSALGALADTPAHEGGRRPLVVSLVLVVSLLGAVRSGAQLVAMQMYENGRSLARASVVDPGNYRLHLRLARSGKRSARCSHALSAHALLPHADAAAALARNCD